MWENRAQLLDFLGDLNKLLQLGHMLSEPLRFDLYALKK